MTCILGLDLEPWLYTDYYFKPSFADELAALTEKQMITSEKDAKLKVKMFVHPEILDDFLLLLAKGYKEEQDEAYTLCERIGLSKRHMDAINGNYKSMQDDIEKDIYSQYQWREKE